ncbi:MAG: DUF2299 family protein [Thermoproteota archaeon]|nr:DUF2299 family protein [Thermoproteota archaeon]
MAEMAAESKRETFHKVIQWLREEGFPKIEVEPDETELFLKVFPLIDEPVFFYIDFRRKTNDSFILGTNIDFTEEDKKSIGALKLQAQNQVYMDIRKLVYPLGINLDTRFPRISLHKLMFFDSLRDKQYFFDSINNLLNAIQLVMIRFDELRVQS